MSSALSSVATPALPPVSLSTVSRVLLIVGSLSLLSATQLSALGFHALNNVLTPKQLGAWHWATKLQFYHSLGLILLALIAPRLGNSKLVAWAGAIMILGLVLFSGTIYVDSLGLAPVGQLAPFGGGSFMLAWLLVAIAAFRARAQ
ncbi:MAG: DUF423 domain-containing protein [Gammaproteobacteria bacterium]